MGQHLHALLVTHAQTLLDFFHHQQLLINTQNFWLHEKCDSWQEPPEKRAPLNHSCESVSTLRLAPPRGERAQDHQQAEFKRFTLQINSNL